MVERVEPMPGIDIMWEPNAPEAVLISDDSGRGALALRAHPNDSDQRAVVLRFDVVSYSAMTPPNDETLRHHRLYALGLNALKWLGVVRDSELVDRLRASVAHSAITYVEPMHFVAGLKECVVEVVAADVDVFRRYGTTRDAALAATKPADPLEA